MYTRNISFRCLVNIKCLNHSHVCLQWPWICILFNLRRTNVEKFRMGWSISVIFNHKQISHSWAWSVVLQVYLSTGDFGDEHVSSEWMDIKNKWVPIIFKIMYFFAKCWKCFVYIFNTLVIGSLVLLPFHNISNNNILLYYFQGISAAYFTKYVICNLNMIIKRVFFSITAVPGLVLSDNDNYEFPF